jgi:hypothetical protein
MSTLELDVNVWAEQQFGECDLGGKRRTRRAVETAAIGRTFAAGAAVVLARYDGHGSLARRLVRASP